MYIECVASTSYTVVYTVDGSTISSRIYILLEVRLRVYVSGYFRSLWHVVVFVHRVDACRAGNLEC